MNKLDEITVVKYETEFVAKHKDFDVIGVGSNEFEAVLELSKALGALMLSNEIELEDTILDYNAFREMHNSSVAYTTKIQNELNEIKQDVARYFDNLKVIDDYKHAHPSATNEELEISLEKEVALYRELFSKITKGVAK